MHEDDDGPGEHATVTVRRMPGGLGSGPLSGGPGSHDVWEVDRLNHAHDMPRFCPECGRGIVDNGGIATEFWRADDRIYHVWCRECGWAGNISRVRRMVGPDSPH